MVMGDLPEQTDLVVVGGGPGGYAAAFRAADLGMDVTVVSDEPRLGGVCLLRGCIPSKALLHVAEVLNLAEEAEQMGVAFGEPKVDLDAVRGWKDGVVDHLVSGLESIAERRGVRIVKGRARFDSPRRVHVRDVGFLEFQQAIVATGSRPTPLPGTEFGGRIMSSDGALDLPDVPERLLVVGGGYIGLEMGSVYAALGSRVTLVEMLDRLMPNADGDLVEPLAQRVGERFAGVHLDTKVTEVRQSEDGVEVAFDGSDAPDETTFERLLIAVGRQPNADTLGLENTGVDLDDDGFVLVDERRRTADERIYAIGDVAGGMLLAHEAMHEGVVAAEAIAGEPSAYDVRAVPAVVYTDPAVAWCGLSEQQAQAEGRDVQVTRFPWRASGRALTMNATEGFTKLVVEPQSQRVLGWGMVGRHAEAMIAEGVLSVEMAAVARDLALTMHPHPTLSETVQEVAQTLAQGATTHLPPGGG
ncbi:MAG TPA: dihydrolipoyl dehydrogenase [Egibacteraceae bacterium]|nr:dihydrolipoyl dehydrogenase [Egibacteraceae bacterium]